MDDRRQRPTSVWDALKGIGRRMGMRRREEHRQPHFVDRFSQNEGLGVGALIALSVIDAVITIELIEAGCSEVNPLMAWLLGQGVMVFIAGKYLLTAGGVPLLLLYKNTYLFNTPLRVAYLIPGFIVLYLALIGYQMALLQG